MSFTLTEPYEFFFQKISNARHEMLRLPLLILTQVNKKKRKKVSSDTSECTERREVANKKTSFDSKVPEEAHSVDALPLKANVTALPEELLIAPGSNIFPFSLLHGPVFHFYGKHELPFAHYESKC